MKPIWIVDDDQSIRFVLEKALAREQLAVRSFTNARDVLRALEEGGAGGGPQVLVSDIRMPGGSGLDLLSRVRERFPALPVISTVTVLWLSRPMARNTSCIALACPSISGICTALSSRTCSRTLSSTAR